MSMRKQPEDRQSEFWIATQDLARPEGHPFYEQLNKVLKEHGFDAFVERRCARFYKSGGRPSIPPGVYFRMLMIGYFEGLDSERGIAWRCADSLGLHYFLGYALTEMPPDHSTLSVIRNRLDLRTHKQVFRWALIVLTKAKLLKGKTVGVDSTTLVANAAMRSIVRRDSGQKYEEFLKELARNEGIEDPSRQDLAKLDRKRKGKGSNDDWFNPHDPDAKITKMKDGRTHLAHKDEHVVDMDTGAMLAVTVQGADLGDTQSLPNSLDEAQANLTVVAKDLEVRRSLSRKDRPREHIEESVTDKGFHSNESLKAQKKRLIRTYCSEPERGRRTWKDEEAQRVVYANRRRIRGERGKALLRRRGELLERPFAHSLETGRMRRVYLRGHRKILKRLLIHVMGMNLGLLMRSVYGVGTPRSLQGAKKGLAAAILVLWHAILNRIASARNHILHALLVTPVADPRARMLAA